MATQFRDRIVGLRRVKASELAPNPKNWRRHPDAQRVAMRAAIGEIGFADVCIAREDEDGRLVLIDGHLRRDIMGDDEVPVIVTDLDEDEADKLLAVLDPLAGMAEVDQSQLLALINTIDLGGVLGEVAADLLASVVPDDVVLPLAENGEVYHTMSFVVSAQQRSEIEDAIATAKGDVVVRTGDTANDNGNAIAHIARAYVR